MRNSAGFSLIELMLSVAIISLLAGMSIPVYFSFVVRNDLANATEQLVYGLRRAGVQARAVNGDSTWGMHIQSGGAVVFKGASYVARDTTYDETISIPTSITPTGATEVTFAKLTALPSTTSNIVLTSNTNDTRTITINAKGTINY